MVEEGSTKKYYNGPQGRVSRSLGTIKLEPLLGSQKVHNSTIIDNNTLLQTHRVEKDHHQPIPPSNHEVNTAHKTNTPDKFLYLLEAVEYSSY